ncbi:hypothetical protein B9Y56_04130 [Stenotrophomonas maltophilia]|nr:hypothetical protein B9Y56_04130 [Stenotrophomonas maltophilia]
MLLQMVPCVVDGALMTSLSLQEQKRAAERQPFFYIWRGTRRALRAAPHVAAQPVGPSLCRPLPAPVGAAPQQRGLLLQMVPCVVDGALMTSLSLQEQKRAAERQPFFYIWRGTRRALRAAPHVAAQPVGPSLCRPLPAPVGAAPQQRGLLLQMVPCVADGALMTSLSLQEQKRAAERQPFFYIWRGTQRALRVAPHVAAQPVGPSLCLPLPAPVGAAPQQRGLLLQMVPCVVDGALMTSAQNL